MEKVKLTQEQAQMIENHRGSFERLMSKRYMKNCPTYIDELTIQQVVDAYFGGYEVEETFRVGDWVVYDNGVERGYGYKTNQIKDVDEQKAYFDEGRRMHLTSLRHATPEEIAEEKQRRWWARHGRNVYEFKEGDLIKRGDLTSEVEEVEEKIIWIKFNKSKGTYTKEYYDQIKVICFAEDRKDLEGEQW